jgi:hypothetical protein
LAVAINKVYNYARMTTATTGTGTITLGAAVPPYLTFAQAGVVNGDLVYYSIIDNANNSIECGIGTYTAAGTTLARTTILRSSGAGNNTAVSLSGNAEVHIEFLANGTTGYPALTAGQIPGTAANDLANAGNIGEYVSAVVLAASAISLTTSTPANITGISLTAGDWNVWGTICYTPAATTTVTSLVGTITTVSSTTSGGFGGANSIAQVNYPALVLGSTVDTVIAVSALQFTLNATTTVFLNTNQVFGVSTIKGYGGIYARRMR